MRLSDILPNAKPIRLLATTRDGAIREMVLALVSAGLLDKTHVESTVRILIDREHLGTTASGNGVAIPHARSPFLSNMAACFGISKSGIEWGALDDQPVRVAILLLSGDAQCGQLLETLVAISRLLHDEGFAKRLLVEQGENDAHS